jgi:hypothetical protein
MYAKIVDNKITDLNAVDGGSGWVLVPADVEGADKIYDTGTSAVRAKTDAEIKAEFDAAVLADSWMNLRQQRDIFLRDTDAHMASDRPATTNMPEYRVYLRNLPSTYNDTSILSQTPVKTFDEFVASL